MSTMKIVDVQQKSDEWLQWRAQGITASDIPIILGHSPYKTKWQLWAEKVGLLTPEDLSNNPNIKRGERLEDVARLAMEEKLDDILLPICAEFGEWPILRASFDGVDHDDHPYELKAPSDNVWQQIQQDGRSSTAFSIYESQVKTQCIVAGVEQGMLVFYLESGEMAEFPITVTAQCKQQILQEAQHFWQLMVDKTAPETDPERDWYIPLSDKDQFQWTGLASSWRSNNAKVQALKDQVKDIEREQKTVQKQLVELMGPFRSANLEGVKATRFQKRGSIDYASFLKSRFPEHDLSEELEQFRKTPREETRFTATKSDAIEVLPVKNSTVLSSAV